MVTSLRDWNLELKYLADSGITSKACIIATGSSAISLKEKTELLPGRGTEGNEYYSKPLDFREFVLQTIDFIKIHAGSKEFSDSLGNLKKILSKIELNLDSSMKDVKAKINKITPFKKELEYFFRIYLMTGGFPGVVNDYLKNKFFQKEGKIESIIPEMFVKDVLGDLAKRNKQEILAREILKSVIDKYASKYSFTNISKSIGSSPITVTDYLEFLEGSFILFILYAYDFSKKHIRFKGNKKIYFIDPFVSHSLSSYLAGKDVNDVIQEMLEDEESLSKLVEGIVCSHLTMSKEKPYLRDAKTFLWFYYNKKEIDFVVKQNMHYLGIEVKYQSGVELRDIVRITPVKNYLLLSKDELKENEDVFIVPVELFLVLLKKSEHNL